MSTVAASSAFFSLDGWHHISDSTAGHGPNAHFARQASANRIDLACRFADFLQHVLSPPDQGAAHRRRLHALRCPHEDRRADIALYLAQHAGSCRLCECK